MHIQTTVVALALVGLSACTAVVPQTQYKVISTPADMQGVTDSFYLQATQISISQNGATTKLTGSNAGKTVTNVSVASVPTEYKDLKLGIRPVNDWRSSTILNITKLDNTDLVSSIGSQVTDNAAKTITDVGGAIVSVITLASAVGIADANQCTLPMTYPLAYQASASRGVEVQSDPNHCISVALQPVPTDAIPVNQIPTGATSNYYYAACRDAVVTVNFGSSNRPSTTVRVADPRWVQHVQFPVQGSVTSASACGVSVKTQATASSDNGAAIVSALATQGKAITDAINASKK